MKKIKVVNIKCSGCINQIKSELEKIGLENVNVNIESLEITFEGDKNKAAEKLSNMGYPQEGSAEAKSMLKKAKSYVSCAIGKTK